MKTFLERYLQELVAKKDSIEVLLNHIMETHDADPIGSAFDDILVPPSQIESFVTELSRSGLLIQSVSPYCNCTKENRRLYDCPHGGGGPRHASGYYSEMYMMDGWHLPDDLQVDSSVYSQFDTINRSNQRALQYALEGMKADPSYSPCLVSAIDILVPDAWYR